ncbi:MAG: serine protease [Bradyrhizobium sp.]|uniref:S1 family peptidase n=1 Tax=Bradyrhizobium sp. TaxID=376 RepID=UPI00120486F9|nr:serine protease [Bradyrhizobium sp.]THD68441.1 MAG: serine protease [Bradyrhizobium sp.]
MKQTPKDTIGILKSIWRKNEAGVWTGHDLKGIDLKPREGCSKDYFKIKSEVNLMTQSPGPVINNFFATFGTTEFLVRQSIVPVIAWNDGDEEIRCIGTGFFISASGLLMTAAHVIRDPVDEDYATVSQVGKNAHKFGEDLHFGVLLPANPAMKNAPFEIHPEVREAKWFMCPFEWAYFWGKDVESPLLHKKPEYKPDLDIAVCKVRERAAIGPYQPLNIGLYSLKLGDRAVAIGYPEMRNIRLAGGDDYQPELIVSVGSVTTIYPDNITEKQNATPGPNFEFNAKIPGKMSGSPILVGGGIITKGIVSRSLGSTDNHASGCLIAPMMNLPSIGSKSLLDLMNGGNEGIAKMIGPGL